MSGLDENTGKTPYATKSRHHLLSKALKILAWTLGGIVIVLTLSLCAITWFLTPERLTEIINTEASRELDADVKVYNARFTIWTSFPHFMIEIDSARVISRTLRDISPALRKELPVNPDFLLSSGRLKAGINICRLINNEIFLHELTVDSLNMNLVSVSDSLSNFNIFRPIRSNRKPPYFTARKLELTNPGRLQVFSRPNHAKMDIGLKSLSFTRSDTSRNTYTLAMKGIVDAEVRQIPLLNGFPFSLSGIAELYFKPLGIRLTDYDVRFGNTSGKVNLDMQLGDMTKINSLSFRIADFNLIQLLRYFHMETLPVPESFHSDIRLNASARLTSPYVFSAKSGLPSAEIIFRISQGEIDYKFGKDKSYSLMHSDILAKVEFNGKSPDSSTVTISPFSISGEGTKLRVEGNVKRIFSDPMVSIDLKGYSDATLAGSVIEPLRSYRIKGNMGSDLGLGFSLSDLHGGNFKNLIAKGNLTFRNYGITVPGTGITATGDRLALNFGVDAGEITDKVIVNGIFDITSDADNLKIASGQKHVVFSNLSARAALKNYGKMRLSEISSTVPLNINLNSASVDFINNTDSLKVSVKNLKADGKIDISPGQTLVNKLKVNINGESASVASGRSLITLDKLSSRFSASAMKSRIIPHPHREPSEWEADSLSMQKVRHSPEYLHIDLPPKFLDIIDRWKTYFSFKASTGTLLTPVLPLHNGFKDLDIEASFDSLKLNNMHLFSQDTRLRLNGEISNLREFLTSPSPALLLTRLDLAIDTVFVNQLCGAFGHGIKLTHGSDASFLTVIPDTLTRTDTVTWLIPRNIAADIQTTATMTEYTDILLHDLSAFVKIRNGNLAIDDLSITSSFGSMKMNFNYDSSDIRRLSMKTGIALADVNLEGFFRRFHTMLLMMPQMRNLTGNLSAAAEAKLQLFPNMYLLMPSIWSDIYLRGYNLKVHQNQFIRHITKMLFIPESSDIKLADMDIHASVHDNLMEVYPFKINFDRYSLSFAGINNFNGEMYYHLGVHKSPLLIPFGINIIGNIKHPEIRLGGASFKSDKAELITSKIMENMKFNFPLKLKCLIREFMEKAAEADTTPASFYVY